MGSLKETGFKAIEKINEEYSFLFPQECIAVRSGIMSAFRKGIPDSFDEKQKSAIEKVCKRYGLVYKTKKLLLSGPGKSDKFIYFAKTEKDIENAFKAEKSGKFNTAFGSPKCCTDFFETELSVLTNSGDRIKRVYENSKGFFFENNSIFNLGSRITYSLTGEKRNTFENVGRLGCYLIFHTPCSFNCNESRKIGQTILGKLKKEEPAYASTIEEILKKPVLFFDDFNWIVLNGKTVNAKKGIVEYDSIADIRSLYPIKEFGEGNKIEVSESEVTVFKDGKEIKKIKKENRLDCVLLPFDAED